MNCKRIENLCVVLANVSGIDYHELSWVGYRKEGDDRIVLVTLLPNKCLSTLQARLSQEEGRELQDIGIVDVRLQVQGKMFSAP